MIFKTQWKTIMAAFVLVLLAAAMFATPVFAEGETPPPEPPATEGEIEEPAEEAPELEQPAAPEEIASPDPQLQPAGETDEEGSGTGAPDEPVTEVQPLAGIYENSLSDPYFNCTDDTVDGTNDGVCRYTNPVTGLQEAVTDYATRGGYGYINVEDGLRYTATGDITINAAPKLTGIRGTGSSLVTWTFDLAYRLAIENMASGFLLSGITIVGNDIDELVHFSGNGGTLTIDDVTIENTGGDGLKIEDHSGAIVLKDVKANNNGGAGASLDNAAGSSSVTVTNGAFNGNGQAGNAVGLEIITDGKATLNGVSASGNKGDGVRILAAQGVAVTNAVMNDNIEDPADPGIFGYGLYVDPATKGSLSLTGVLASGNAADGLRLGTNSSITLKNVNANNSLAGSGLRICNAGCDAPGATTVTLTGVSEFSNNALSGAVIKASGSVTIYRARFMNNLAPTADEDYALFVQTPGTIKLYSVVSQGNNYGVLLDNDLAGATGSVYLYNNYGDNHFDGSISGHGIQVKSNGTVYMKGVYASDNLLDGINIANDETGRTGSVSLYDVFAYGNDQEGIDVVSNGVIKLSGVAAGGNVHQGASLKNDISGGSPSVSVSNSYFNGNTGSGGANDSDGLYIFTKGSVTVTNVHASDNEENGVYIYNLADLLPSSVSVRCTTAEACQFNNNGGNGLFIYANGKVTLSNLALNDNDVNGGFIDNVGSSQGYPLTLTNLNAHNNGQHGFLFTTSGSVTITNINADGNGFFGVDIDADQGYGTVTIKRTIAGWNSFNDNGTQDGLVINALNTIVLQKIQANGNGRYGANLNNCRQQVVNGPCTGLGGITVSGTSTNPNQFNQNGILGLNAVSSGTITITNI
ncbi:MAG: right-handed parallel beta-helix repeat-containing protein, partial [Anaerolineae bacterium]|nr:right-handed parallel beta-helix repeat-containing protein [Anaerolineae bacterium]